MTDTDDRMIDLHCHILPAVDDGAADVADAVEMAKAAVAQGCRAVFATSHLGEGLFDTSVELIRSEYAVLLRALKRERIDLEVRLGAENSFPGSGPPTDFPKWALPLGDGPWLLFDFSLRTVPPGVGEAIDALVKMGRRPIVAHPERNLELQRDPSPIVDWVRRGARMQINAASVVGLLGEDSRRVGRHLIERGAAHFVASDAHSIRRRPFCLAKGRTAIAKFTDQATADRLCFENPWRVARGETIDAGKPDLAQAGRARRLFRRLPGIGG